MTHLFLLPDQLCMCVCERENFSTIHLFKGKKLWSLTTHLHGDRKSILSKAMQCHYSPQTREKNKVIPLSQTDLKRSYTQLKTAFKGFDVQ